MNSLDRDPWQQCTLYQTEYHRARNGWEASKAQTVHFNMAARKRAPLNTSC